VPCCAIDLKAVKLRARKLRGLRLLLLCVSQRIDLKGSGFRQTKDTKNARERALVVHLFSVMKIRRKSSISKRC
jgi:hypothetical protein